MYIVFSCLTLSLLSSPVSVYCSRRAAWVHSCFSLLTYYCRVTRFMLLLKEPAKEIMILHWLLFLFVCFNSEIEYIWGIFVIYVSEIIQQYELLTTCPFYHAVCILTLPCGRSTQAVMSQHAKCELWIPWCKDPNQIHWQWFWNRGRSDMRPFPPFLYHFAQSI